MLRNAIENAVNRCVPPSRGILLSEQVLHKVIMTCLGMQLRMCWTVRCAPPYTYLVVKISTMSAQLEILQNAIEKADDRFTPH